MSEASPHPRILHLVIEGLPADRLAELSASGPGAEIFPLTEASAREALEKIFASDHIAVWGKL